jgi:toxin ParE1/3/4
MKIKISKEANEDIEKIWLYTFENWSIEQADRYYNLIMDEMSISNVVYQPQCLFGHSM